MEAFVKAPSRRAFQDKAMMKYLLNWIAKLPKEAFVDDKVYTFKVTQSQWDLMERVEQDVATWFARTLKQSRAVLPARCSNARRRSERMFCERDIKGFRSLRRVCPQLASVFEFKSAPLFVALLFPAQAPVHRDIQRGFFGNRSR